MKIVDVMMRKSISFLRKTRHSEAACYEGAGRNAESERIMPRNDGIQSYDWGFRDALARAGLTSAGGFMKTKIDQIIYSTLHGSLLHCWMVAKRTRARSSVTTL
jgi:hypothetical protein